MIGARELTIRLGGRWHRHYGTAPCPVCQPERRADQNALTLHDGSDRLLLHCKKMGCAFRDILRALGILSGDYCQPNPAELVRREADRRAEIRRRALRASLVWQEARPIAGTVGESYLRKARRITCPLPRTLRYHPEAWHGPSAKKVPALVALVEGSDSFAVHRTYLLPDGSDKAPLKPAKAMLGAVAGGAVRLVDAPGELVVAEGIETALSLACGLIGSAATVWAALSTSGMRGVRLPPQPGRLTIASDGDPAGRAAAFALAERAASASWAVSLLSAPAGRDWNDVLKSKRDHE